MEAAMHMGDDMFSVRMFLRCNKHLSHYADIVDEVLLSSGSDETLTIADFESSICTLKTLM